MTDKPCNSSINVRVPRELRRAFIARAKRHGQTSDVLRELLAAFAEDRVVISPPVNAKEPLYVTRKSA